MKKEFELIGEFEDRKTKFWIKQLDARNWTIYRENDPTYHSAGKRPATGLVEAHRGSVDRRVVGYYATPMAALEKLVDYVVLNETKSLKELKQWCELILSTKKQINS